MSIKSTKESIKISEPFYRRTDAGMGTREPISQYFLNLSRIPSEVMLKIFSFLKEDKKTIKNLSQACQIFSKAIKLADFLKKPAPKPNNNSIDFSFNENDLGLDEISIASLLLSDCFKAPVKISTRIIQVVNAILKGNYNLTNNLIDDTLNRLKNENTMVLNEIVKPDDFSIFTNNIVESLEDWLFTIDDDLSSLDSYNDVEKYNSKEFCEKVSEQKNQIESFIIKVLKTLTLMTSNEFPKKDTFSNQLRSLNIGIVEDDLNDIATSYYEMVQQFKNFDENLNELNSKLDKMPRPSYQFI